TLIDVILTLDYTALFDPGYRLKVTRELPRTIAAERTFSMRSAFPDAWYAVQNGGSRAGVDDSAAELVFTISEADFPQNHGSIVVSALTIFALTDPADGEAVAEIAFT